jgi:hypothetical protein
LLLPTVVDVANVITPLAAVTLLLNVVKCVKVVFAGTAPNKLLADIFLLTGVPVGLSTT